MSRGPYANGERRRTQLRDAAFTVFAQQGFRGASLRVIAERAGTSHTALLAHFGSKAGLLKAVLERHREAENPFRRQVLADKGVLAGAVEIMRRNAEFPGLIYLDATMSAEGIDPEHPAHDWYTKVFADFMEGATEDVQRAVTEGQIRPDIDVRTVARLLLAVINGLQVQWLYNPEEANMADHVGAFLDLLKPLPPAVP